MVTDFFCGKRDGDSTVRFGMRMTTFLLAAAASLVSAYGQKPIDLTFENRVDAAIKSGSAALIRARNSRGFYGDEIGPHLLATLALLHAGFLPTQHEVVDGLRLLDVPIRDTYRTALRLMLVAEIKEATEHAGKFLFDVTLMRRAAEDLAFLLEAQSATGGWSYGARGGASVNFDNSNTQYAVLGLRAARRLGLEVPRSARKRSRSHWKNSTSPYGGAGYQDCEHPTVSMTAAALSSFSILDELDGDQQADRNGRAEIMHCTEWLEKHWNATNPDFYALYGIERAMGLSGQSRMGKRDWYREGAETLLKMQLKSGAWSTDGDVVSTSFALLFLTRASQKQSAGTTPRSPATLIGKLGRSATEAEIDEVVADIEKLGPRVLPDLVPFLEDRESSFRTAAFRALKKWLTTDFGYDPRASIDENRGAVVYLKEAAKEIADAAVVEAARLKPRSLKD